MGTVAYLSLKIILSVQYNKNLIFALFFLSPLIEHTNASLRSQLPSPSWVFPLILQSEFFCSFSSPREIKCDWFGSFAIPWGGWINWQTKSSLLTDVGADFSKKCMGFSHWDFGVFLFFGFKQYSWEFL